MAGKPIHVALAAAKKAVGSVAKEQRNSQQGFNFRGVDAVVNAVAPKLNEEGIIVLPEVMSYDFDTVEIGKNKTSMGHIILKVRYRFVGPEGDYLDAVVMSESMDSGDKGVAKAMSVAYRIALLQVLNLPTDEPDPDESSYERSGASRPNPINTRYAGNAQNAENGKNPDFVILARNAKTVDDVRNVWKAAGAAGALKTEITVPGTGEKMTLQEYFTARADEIGFEKAHETLKQAELV